MGTRINYEIMNDEGDAAAVTLYSNSSHEDVDGESLFRYLAGRTAGPSELVARMLSMVYETTQGNNRAGDPIFTIDLDPHDREFVMRACYPALFEGRGLCGVVRIDEPGPGDRLIGDQDREGDELACDLDDEPRPPGP